MDRYLAVIPARYASTRFPGKPLARLKGKTMIQWVYEGASQRFDHLVVATDDRRILEAVQEFGGQAVLTDPAHPSGTDRCAEAARIMQKRSAIPFSHVVNIQGDEPLIRAEQLDALLSCFQVADTRIATLVRPLEDLADLQNPNVVKVVLDKEGKALYFSRAPIPYLRDREKMNEGFRPAYTHLGLYAFRSETLDELIALPPSALELTESLEQLRWLENAYEIQTAKTSHASRGVDCPEDLERLEKDLLL